MTKTYEARYVPGAEINLDGIINELAWEQANLETGFAFPWENRPVPRTEFRALFDDWALYFAFRADDDDVVLAEDYQGKEDVVREDRVELFFALDDELANYYCLEIDPLGRVLDYHANYYRRFDRSWACPGLDVTGRRTEEGYRVEGLIPLRSLQLLGFPALDSGRPIKFGIYRAEFSHTEGSGWSESWISWVDPQTAEPDFHVPASFGRLVMRR
ncbi:MAG: endoxylanase [Planctomycetaceae bacterium]|nr:endoxylanase [Planctomycetaceae bacterium]